MSLYVITCRYIFFTDKVEVEDITTRTKLFVLVGPNSNKVNLRDTLFFLLWFNVLYYIFGDVYHFMLMLTGHKQFEHQRSCWTTIWFAQALQCKSLAPRVNCILHP